MSESLLRYEAPREKIRYHFTLLSNFAIGFDRYSRVYSKREIVQSRFPSKFFLLAADNLAPGIQKSRLLLDRVGIGGDAVIALKTTVSIDLLHPNLHTHIGEYVESDAITLDEIFKVAPNNELIPLQIEDAYSEALRLVRPLLPSWNEVSPRSASVLPIARGCQAACPFCFSEASISKDMKHDKVDLEHVALVFDKAKERGAERAVITGGGEPGLLPFDRLNDLIKVASDRFSKVVLITNGYFLGRLDEDKRREALQVLKKSGLTVLAISKHHSNPEKNTELMKLDTRAELVSQSWQEISNIDDKPRLRWICVLQKGGVQSKKDISTYIQWAVSNGVSEVCFKELYVSSHIESYYHSEASNEFSKRNQVPLRLVLELAKERGWKEAYTLPWGSPVFEAHDFGSDISIAAYTEPNVTWELTHGLCRSWNLMADGSCYASLEDLGSRLEMR